MTSLTFEPYSYFYHATNDFFADLICKEIIITKRKNGGVDFGPGFYLTQVEEQAIEFAQGKAAKGWPVPDLQLLNVHGMTIRDFIARKDELQPVIIKYKLKNPHYWVQLIKDKELMLFTKANIQWKKHVWTWRKANHPPRDWLATFGPVADGYINYPTHEKVKAFAGMDQLAIHDASLANTHLEIVEVISC